MNKQFGYFEIPKSIDFFLCDVKNRASLRLKKCRVGAGFLEYAGI